MKAYDENLKNKAPAAPDRVGLKRNADERDENYKETKNRSPMVLFPLHPLLNRFLKAVTLSLTGGSGLAHQFLE
jgi:hypothetical protein